METRIGYMDVKSSPVHFYVQRNSLYSRQNAVIPFELERLNAGGAMNTKTGVFTAPRNGTYHFSFSFLKDGRPDKFVTIFMRKNGETIAATQGSGANKSHLQSSITATLKLKLGDKVDLFEIHGGTIYSDDHFYTSFTGWLVEEDLDILNWILLLLVGRHI